MRFCCTCSSDHVTVDSIEPTSNTVIFVIFFELCEKKVSHKIPRMFFLFCSVSLSRVNFTFDHFSSLNLTTHGHDDTLLLISSGLFDCRTIISSTRLAALNWPAHGVAASPHSRRHTVICKKKEKEKKNCKKR